MKDAEDWQVAARSRASAPRARELSQSARRARKSTERQGQRASSIVGDWADADGMLCRLKADGTVLVPPSRGSGGAWKVERGRLASVEIALALAQTTRWRPPATASTRSGSISGSKMTGAVETDVRERRVGRPRPEQCGLPTARTRLVAGRRPGVA